MRLATLLLSLGIAAAQNSDLAGTWTRTAGSETVTLELKPDGGAALNGAPLRWTFESGKLSLHTGQGAPRVAAAEVTTRTLTLKPAAGEPIVFQRAGAEQAPPGCKGVVGTWRAPDTTVTLAADGTTVINGVKYRYADDGKTLTMTGADGTFRFPYRLEGGVLTVQIGGQPVALTCAASAPSGGPNPRELAGKWCAISNFNTYNGGRISSSCVMLNPDGTYEYNAETSSSGPVASQATQEWDRGTWTATENTVTARSRTRGTTTVYTLEKRNHPKTKDPMIVLDGQAFVTYSPRAPW